MDSMQKSMGDNYTVSEDIGVWGFGGVDNEVRGTSHHFQCYTHT